MLEGSKYIVWPTASRKIVISKVESTRACNSAYAQKCRGY